MEKTENIEALGEQEELIIVKQMPVIEEHLRRIKDESQARVDQALNMEVNEDTRKAVKGTRADLKKLFDSLEKRRKFVKSKILEPYEAFENVYKECVTDIFQPADEELKRKIDAVEQGLKDKAIKEIRDFFNEYKASKNIDFLTFEDAKIDMKLNNSERSLKKQIREFVDRVAREVVLIRTDDLKEELLVEYKKTLNITEAFTIVRDRHKAIATEKTNIVEMEKVQAEKAEVEAKVQEAIIVESPDVKTPQNMTLPDANIQDAEIINQDEKKSTEPVYSATFVAYGTISQLKKLKEFMNQEGIRYESK